MHLPDVGIPDLPTASARREFPVRVGLPMSLYAQRCNIECVLMALPFRLAEL